MTDATDIWAIEECIDYGAPEAPAYDPPIEVTAREQLRALLDRLREYEKREEEA